MKSHHLSHNTIITGVVLIIAAAALTLDGWVYFQIRNHKPIQATSPVVTTDTMADWNTYSNEVYSFRYPSKDWQVTSSNLWATIEYTPQCTTTECHSTIIDVITTTTSIQNFIKNYNKSELSQVYKQEPYSINNIAGTKLLASTEIGIPKNYFFFEKAGKQFILIYYAGDDEVINQILSTFRFTDDISDWQTYTNDKSDYTFTYPKSWVADDCGSNGQMIHITPTTIPCGADWYGNGFVVTKLKNKAERDQMIAQEKKSLSNFQKTSITIAGKPAIRITGTNLKTPANGEMNLPNDSPSDQVFVTNNGTEYFIMNQTFAVSSPYAKEFETFLSTFRFTDDVSDSQMYTDTSPLCTAKPVSTEIGSEIYPSDTKYQKLTFLGPIFTAYKCSSSRLNAVLGNSNGQYTLGSTVWLKTAPSQQLITTLKAVGYLCSEKVSDASCKKWRLVKFVNVTDIMKLEPFSEQLEADDCVFCG